MAGLGALRAQWNALLLRCVAADAYVALLEAARPLLGPSPAYAALWPAQPGTAPQWQDLVQALFARVGRRQVAFTQAASPLVEDGDGAQWGGVWGVWAVWASSFLSGAAAALQLVSPVCGECGWSHSSAVLLQRCSLVSPLLQPAEPG